MFKHKLLIQKIVRNAPLVIVALVVGGIGARYLLPTHAQTTSTSSLPRCSASNATNQSFLYGVLGINKSYMTSDYNAGVRLASINIEWSSWQPNAANQWDPNYPNFVKQQMANYVNQGYCIELSFGLQYPPSWVLSMQDGQLVNQYDETSGTPNYEFNTNVRQAAATYIKNVLNTISLNNVIFTSVGLKNTGELGFGLANNTNNSWWAFDNIAQNKDSGLAYGDTVNPMPGWIPGALTYLGKPVTAGQVQQWYNWYMNASIAGTAWEIRTLRDDDYNGLIQLKMPGQGTTPQQYSERLAANLAPEHYDSYNTMNSGDPYYLLLNRLPDLTNVVVDETGTDDGSGTPRGNQCKSTDTNTALTNADPWVSNWSSARWLTYLADQHHLPIMGENPGNNNASDMTNALALARSCDFMGLSWAFDSQLYDPTACGANITCASIEDYANYIAAHP